MRGRRNLTKEKVKARDMWLNDPTITGRDLGKALGISNVTGYNWIKEFRGDSPNGKPSTKPVTEVTLGEFVEELYNKYAEMATNLNEEREKRVKAETQLDQLQGLVTSLQRKKTSVSNLFKEFNQILTLQV